MGTGVSRCIYCGAPIDAKSPVIGTDYQSNSLPGEKQERTSKIATNILWIAGLLLAGIGSVLSFMLPIVGIPAVIAGGWMLFKANKSQKK